MATNLKRSTVHALKEMAALTGPKCGTCHPQETMPRYRCCATIFCRIAEVTIRELGGSVDKANADPEAELPYMGETGCVVPPELRPVCTGFVCKVHLESSKPFARRWQKLQTKLNSDPNLRRAVSKAREEVGGLEGAINDYRARHLIFEEAPDAPAK